MVISVKDTKEDLGIPFTSNPYPEQLDRGCDNNADSNLGTPFICNPSENTKEKSTGGQDNEDGNDKANDRIEKLKERLEKSHSNDDKKAKSESEDLQLNPDVKNNNDKNNDKNNDNNDGNRQLNNQPNIQQNNEDNEGDNDEANTDKGEDKKPSEQQQLLEQQEENKAKDANNGDYEGDDKQGSNDEANTDKGEDKKPSEQQQLLEQQEENKAKDENNYNDGNNGNNQRDDNNDEKLGIGDLDLNIEEKQDKVNKKIEKLKDKINNEDNQLLLEQQEEDKGIDQDNKKQYNDDEEELKITGLDLKIQKIQANLDKKIEKLKDKIQNDKDNQLLIEQRDDDDDDDDDDGGNKDDGDHETYDGYGFDGGNDDGNDNDDKNFNFATAGDFGCSKNTQNTVANMEKKEPELVLALGDLSYHSTADCWFDIMSPLKGKMMITLGSHDTNDGQAKLNQYVKSFELDKPYYSYDYKNVHFLVMASLSDFKERSEQYNFIKQDLEKASQNKDINWIIVSTYKPLYTSPSEHKAEGELRELYHPLFEKYGVDLVLGGHNHNYQRTYPLTFNPDKSSTPITTNGVTTGYNNNKDGIVFATVGTGGVNLYGLDGKEPYMATQFTSKFGFLNIDINNGNPDTKLTGTFYDNKGNNVLDEFTIEKEIKNKNKNSEVSYT